DAHNATAVLALPYHLMITYTGLVTLMFLYMPWGPQAVYKEDRQTFVAEVFPSSTGFSNQPRSGVATPLVSVADLMREAISTWHGAPVSRIVLSNPGDATARVTLYRDEGGKLSSNQSSMSFDGTSGKLLGRAGEDIAPASDTRGVLYGLHIGRFANPLLRWLFFVSGIAGCVMVATGLLMWSVKERQQYAKVLAKGGRVGLGLRLVDGLNVGAVAGLPLAMAAFFWANRLVPVGIAERQAVEIACFFWAWGLAAVAGLAWPARRMWQVQLALGGLLFALLPVLNPLTGGMGLLASVPAGQWRVAGFDLTVLVLGAGLLAAAWYVGKRKPAAKPRTATAKAETPVRTPEPRLETAGAGQ
ncbi:MAG TPA: PepSY-associated TM helix domain-containing protein, partial [Pseudorhodoferax sp.]|nr:PepSY-associated TM helix domain-containing protein [Pseudorhodoferax sp.]